jgi:hypothetical protein
MREAFLELVRLREKGWVRKWADEWRVFILEFSFALARTARNGCPTLHKLLVAEGD